MQKIKEEALEVTYHQIADALEVGQDVAVIAYHTYNKVAGAIDTAREVAGHVINNADGAVKAAGKAAKHVAKKIKKDENVKEVESADE